MANALPWSVRGIDPDIREQAVEAAHRSGMSVGQWLNQVLAGNLDDQDDDEPVPMRSRTGSRQRPRRTEMLSERLERIAYNDRQTSAIRGYQPQPDDNRLLDLIEQAVTAIERIEKRHVSPESPRSTRQPHDNLAETLKAFEQKLEQLAAPRAVPAQATYEPPRQGGAVADADPAFTRTLAEIESRRRNLDGDAAPANTPVRTAGSGQIDKMSEQLSALISRIDDMRSERPAVDTGLRSRLDDLAQQISRWRETPSSVANLQSELATLSTAVSNLHPSRLVAALDDAVARTMERAIRSQHEGGDRVLESLGRLNEDVRAIQRDLNQNSVADRLGLELGNLSKRLDLVSNAVGGVRLEDLQRETQALKSAVEQVSRNNPAELLTRKLDDIAGKLDRRDEAAVLIAIEGLSNQVRSLGSQGIKTLESQLAEMTREMKKLAADKQPMPQMSAIADRLERIDRLLDHRPDSTLGGLDAIAGSLNKISEQLDREPNTADSAVVTMLSEINARFDRLQTPDNQELDHLRSEIRQVFNKLDTLGASPKGLDTLERGVADLFARIDQTRQDMRMMAEQAAKQAEMAARQAAEHALSQAPRDDANDTLAAEGLLLIKRDLNEFKTAQSEAERRTRGTLEALHETLSGIVGKLTELEHRKPEPAPVMMAPRADMMAPRPEAPVQREPATAKAPPQAPRREPTIPVADLQARSEPMGRRDDAEARFNPDADLPLEPGLQPGDAPASLTSDPRNQFIAAARRAAQAAADSSQAALASEPNASKAGKMRAAMSGGAGSLLARARKPILLGLAALIFSLGALKVLTSRMNPGDESPVPPLPQKPAISAPANGGVAPAPKEGADAKDDPKTTGSVARPPAAEPQQTLPTPREPGTIPSIQPSGMMTLPGGKRGQKLSETTAVTQADPATTGSITDGANRPAETGRAAINDLVAQSGLKPQDKLRDAALQGNMAAWFELGVRFADGKGVPRDGKLAARWFEQAALGGHGPSQYRLASLYREGKVVAKEPTLAFQWFDRAAAQGHVLAMHNAAVLLAEGVHGAPDYAGAALWFKRAAEHGIKDSQFNVAILFARGLGVNQNLQEAYRWFAIAAAQGDQDAAKKRDDIAARLTKDQIAKENDRVKAFKALPANAAANDPGNWDRPARQGT